MAAVTADARLIVWAPLDPVVKIGAPTTRSDDAGCGVPTKLPNPAPRIDAARLVAGHTAEQIFAGLKPGGTAKLNA